MRRVVQERGLVGDLFYADAVGPRPTVIMLGGSEGGKSWSDNPYQAVMLVDAGLTSAANWGIEAGRLNDYRRGKLMRTLLTLTASCLAILALAAANTPATAQQTQMGEAAHRGTYNYLRIGPDRHARILEKMPQGTRFEVVGMQNDYYAVILEDGTHGWTASVNVRFLRQPMRPRN